MKAKLQAILTITLALLIFLPTPTHAALTREQLDNFGRWDPPITFFDPTASLCSSAFSSTPTNTGNIPYQLPATSGGYGHEEAIQADGTIASTGGSVAFAALARTLPQEYRDYAINMRWNYAKWYWNGTSTTSGGDGSANWFSERPRMILVSNPATGKNIYATALEAGPAPWTGYALTSSDIRNNPPAWWNQPQFGTPPQYRGRVAGLTPQAYQYLEAGQGDGQTNVQSNGSVKGQSLIYAWAADQTVKPGPTHDIAIDTGNPNWCSWGALSPGGITDIPGALALAREFIAYVNSKVGGRAPAVPSSAAFGQALGTPGQNFDQQCDGVSCGQCTALTKWFVTYKTNYTYGGGDGGMVVRNLASSNRDLNTGAEPLQPYTIFSWKESSNTAGHTGIVIGILDDGSIITLENNMGSATGGHQLMVRKLSPSDWRSRVTNAASDIPNFTTQFAFAYVGDKLK